MSNATDITGNFDGLYHPKSALVFYGGEGTDSEMYVEHYDMDKNGNPINAHPLTVREARALSKALLMEKDKDKAFLKPKGILPPNVLHINPSENGSVIWYTKARERGLYFIENLGIPSGNTYVPPMLWYANKNSLVVFALASDRRPVEKTPLYHAPFFNVYENGNVCMGSVDVNIKKSASVEEFTTAWESYFFDSYFSHLMEKHNPVNGNCVSIWKKQMETGQEFPKEVLVKNNRTLKNLLR